MEEDLGGPSTVHLSIIFRVFNYLLFHVFSAYSSDFFTNFDVLCL